MIGRLTIYGITPSLHHTDQYPAQKLLKVLILHPLGAGAGLTGLPGDYTPPSRFVKAFFFT
jgi:penicillin V acylase-like amidase (Ntn superfamily)